MLPEEFTKLTLTFIGCKSVEIPSSSASRIISPNDLASRVFKPAIQWLTQQGYLRSKFYGFDDKLSSDCFIGRDKTEAFVDKLIQSPNKKIIICAWFDHAEKAAERLIEETNIPVVYLLLRSVRGIYFNIREEPLHAIWLSSNWKRSYGSFVRGVTDCINDSTTLTP